MSKELQEKLNELEKGLKLLSRDRKVVLPHHKTFDLIDEMLTTVKELKTKESSQLVTIHALTLKYLMGLLILLCLVVMSLTP